MLFERHGFQYQAYAQCRDCQASGGRFGHRLEFDELAAGINGPGPDPSEPLPDFQQCRQKKPLACIGLLGLPIKNSWDRGHVD